MTVFVVVRLQKGLEERAIVQARGPSFSVVLMNVMEGTITGTGFWCGDGRWEAKSPSGGDGDECVVVLQAGSAGP